MLGQSVGILLNNGVALFSMPCYTIGIPSSGGEIDLYTGIYIYRNDRTMPKAKATPKQTIA